MDFTTIFWIITAIAVLWALYDILFVNDLTAQQKIFWIIVLILLLPIGIVMVASYILVARSESEYKIVKR